MVEREGTRIRAHVKELSVENLTVFQSASLKFSPTLNVIIGENGTGKTHILKLVYALLEVLSPPPQRAAAEPTKNHLQARIADKLTNVFRAESLGRLARRQRGRQRCDIVMKMSKRRLNTAFNFATQSKTEVVLTGTPDSWLDGSPAYIPTRELLTIFPNFVSLYDKSELEFDETWRDTCVLLGLPLARGPRAQGVDALLSPLETAMGGRIEFDKSGRFYFRNSTGRVEMPLVAEGIRKLGMIARLIATGALLENGFLFWDEPEANLNPTLVKEMAPTILHLCQNGIQVFIATHSLFLLREINILLSKSQFQSLAPKYFILRPSEDGVNVEQAASLDGVGSLAVLDEEINQSERYLELEA